MKKPETSIELVLKWAKQAAKNCRKQRRNDAGQLWEDTVAHLEYFKYRNNEFKQVLSQIPAVLLFDKKYKEDDPLILMIQETLENKHNF